MANSLAAEITKRSRSNFYYSFLLLSPLQREAMHVLYAFCRNTDNIVDEIGDHTAKSVKLKEWAAELVNALHGQSAIPLLNQLRDVIRQFAIPSEYCFELIKGVEMDLAKTRYRTFEELYRYCYRVASTVGLMSIRIFGSQSEKAKGYALKLGIALQLTNILRDVKTDAAKGIIYFPQEDLQRFGCSEEDILQKHLTPQFIELMKFQCARARYFFRQAEETLGQEHHRLFFSAKIMAAIYFRLLERIEQAGYDVFRKNITVPRWYRIWLSLRIWTQHQFLTAP